MKRLNQKLESEFRDRIERPFFSVLQEFYQTPAGGDLYQAAMKKWPPGMWQMFSGQLDIAVNRQVKSDMAKLGKKNQK